MTQRNSNLATTFTAPPSGGLVDQTGLATQRFQVWLNALFKRFLIARTNLQLVTGDYQCVLSDCTLQVVITLAAKVTLPDPTQIQGQIVFIKNDATSTATVTLAAALNRLIDNALAPTYTLNPGNCLILESDGTNWIILARDSTNAQASTAPLNPGGTTPPPPVTPPTGPPTVTALPASGEPGQQVVFNGTLYQWVGAAQFAGISGFWEPVVATAPTLQGTHAVRLASYPASGQTAGTLFYETDRLVIYMVQAGAWVYYSGAMNGPLASLPSDLGASDAGFYFQCTDFKHLYKWSGSVWAFDANDQGSNFTVFASPGFFLSSGLWGLCDGSTYSVALGNGTTTNITTSVITNTYLRR